MSLDFSRRMALIGALGVALAPLETRAAALVLADGDGGKAVFDPDAAPIPLDLKLGLVRVQATVNGRPVGVIIDSGVSYSVIDSTFAKSLGLKVNGETTGSGSGATVAGQTFAGCDVTIGGYRMSNLQIGGFDLSALHRAAPDVMILIGGDLLNVLAVDFDFPARRLGLHLTGRTPAIAGGVTEALEDGERGLHKVRVRVEDRPVLWAMMDLGDAGALTMSAHWAREHGLLAGKRTSIGKSAAIDGIVTDILITLDSLTLAGHTFRNVPARLTENWNEPDVPVNIGLPLMRRFRMITDFRQRQALFAADPATIGLPLAKDRAGLNCERLDGRLRVLFVCPGSPAEKEGWKVGDEIIAIDGHPILREPTQDRDAGWSEVAAGTRVVLTMADKSRRTLALADYF